MTHLKVHAIRQFGRPFVLGIVACFWLLRVVPAAYGKTDPVETTIKQLSNKSPSMRGIAADTLGKMKDPRVVEPLIAALQDSDAHVREHVVIALGIIKDPRAVEALIAVLRDPVSNVRREAAASLGEMKDPRAADALIVAFKDSDVNVRGKAAEAVVSIGAPAVEPLLAALTESDANVRACAAITLGEIKDPRSVDALIATLKDADAKVRGWAAVSLGAITDHRALESLMAALKDANAGVRVYAARSLSVFKDPRAIDDLIAAFKDPEASVRGWAARGLIDIGASAVEPLSAALKDADASVRMYAALALGEVADPRSIEPLIAALKDPDQQVQQRAGSGLVAIGAPAVPLLVTAMKGSDVQIQKRAGAVLGAIGTPALDPLIAALRDPNEQVRQAAFLALGQIKDPRAGDQLVAALGDSDPGVKQMATAALAKSGMVIVDSRTLSSISSLGADLVFFTSREHPIARLSDITDPSTQFAVAEFSQRTMALRLLIWGGSGDGAATAAGGGYSGTGVQFGANGTMRPLGDTYQSAEGTTLMGIGDEAFGSLFQKHPQLRLFVATRGTGGIEAITSTGGGMKVRFVEDTSAGVRQTAAVALGKKGIFAETARDGRFIAYNNGTVLDTKTNLMWAAKDNGQGLDWEGAKSYCENFHAGGYTDWRMPYRDELPELYDATKAQPVTSPPNHPKQNDMHLATELIKLTDPAILAAVRPEPGLIGVLGIPVYLFQTGENTSEIMCGKSCGGALPVRSVPSDRKD